MNYYISDLHCWHKNAIGFDNRPFKDVDEMNGELIKNWNSVVTDGDDVYVVGDMCWSHSEKDWTYLLDNLNGRIHLILGNHDVKRMSENLQKKFAECVPYLEINDNGREVLLSHFPMMLYKHSYNQNTYMICGHVHTNREDSLLTKWRMELWRTRSSYADSYGNIINVGCMKDYMNYTPQTLNYLIDVLNKEREKVKSIWTEI